MGGMVLETNMNEIVAQVEVQNRMEKSEVSPRTPDAVRPHVAPHVNVMPLFKSRPLRLRNDVDDNVQPKVCPDLVVGFAQQFQTDSFLAKILYGRKTLLLRDQNLKGHL